MIERRGPVKYELERNFEYSGRGDLEPLPRNCFMRLRKTEKYFNENASLRSGFEPRTLLIGSRGGHHDFGLWLYCYM
jgi:hypothetical protein